MRPCLLACARVFFDCFCVCYSVSVCVNGSLYVFVCVSFYLFVWLCERERQTVRWKTKTPIVPFQMRNARLKACTNFRDICSQVASSILSLWRQSSEATERFLTSSISSVIRQNQGNSCNGPFTVCLIQQGIEGTHARTHHAHSIIHTHKRTHTRTRTLTH